MWKRCGEVTVSGRACIFSMHACMRARVCQTVYFWVPLPGGEREGAGAEGQTRCGAVVSECRGPVLLLRPGYYSGAQSRVVMPTRCARFYYIYQAEKTKQRNITESSSKCSFATLSFVFSLVHFLSLVCWTVSLYSHCRQTASGFPCKGNRDPCFQVHHSLAEETAVAWKRPDPYIRWKCVRSVGLQLYSHMQLLLEIFWQRGGGQVWR